MKFIFQISNFSQISYFSQIFADLRRRFSQIVFSQTEFTQILGGKILCYE